MDSDVTSDSLSSPADPGLDIFSSFASIQHIDQMSTQRSGVAALDSLDLSPATNASTQGSAFLDESQRSSSLLQKSSRAFSERAGTSYQTEIKESRGDENHTMASNFSEGGDSSRISGAAQASPDATGDVRGLAPARKRFKKGNATATDGYEKKAGRECMNSRLESSWPSFGPTAVPSRRSFSATGELWEASQSSRSPCSQKETATSATRGHRSSEILGSGPLRSGFSKSGPATNDGACDIRDSQSESGSGGRLGSGMSTNKGSLVSTGSGDIATSGGVGDAYSASEGSSHGLPAPPVIPSGPLPAIGALKEVCWFNTRHRSHVAPFSPGSMCQIAM